MNRSTALDVLTDTPMNDIEAMCTNIRKDKFGTKVDLCAIINSRNGACSEDCAFCAQSHSSGTPMLELSEIIEAQKAMSEAGIHRISMVTSGRALDSPELDTICKAASTGSKETPVCASLGILGLKELRKLKKSGVSRYHHNLETSENFFPSICTTHLWSERVTTIKNAKIAGLSVCAGGILGIGESDKDRIDLAFALKKLEVESVALNFYLPVEGARVKAEQLSPEKMIRIIAMFRLVNPSSEIRICAGRAGLELLGDKMFAFGVTGIMTGVLLTTEGSQLADDLNLIAKAGFNA